MIESLRWLGILMSATFTDRRDLALEKLAFQVRVSGMGIEQILTSPQSPWQSPFVERLIGSIRRECVDRVIVLGERQLRRILTSYYPYYHRCRTHLGLEKDAPEPRPIQPLILGAVVEFPEVGGLHHRYERRAA